ncbi:MAG: hypothetical protein BLM47_10660 [Candidatus Reconcilbacillus cellulovorans]|uniref:Uncharacterized protein n=1 Tax=Candidatus Reconcilbacillus cellulovorans TaxID=1906605 RepID=A0A2A6DYD0_9BACL|nr:MAG: hypothetical protein BLM47_10660 [Candidatus Reconcilbacillus cellulovorans]
MRIGIDDGMETATIADLAELEAWWKSATRRLFGENRLIRCVVIDGTPYYEGYEHALRERFDRIGEVRIISMTCSEWFDDTVRELAGYLVSIAQAVDRVRASMYGCPSSSDWNVFAQLLEGLHWIYEVLKAFSSYLKENGKTEESRKWLDVSEKLESAIRELAAALERNETISIGDVLEYELKPVVLQISELISQVKV